jgi:hypothetical protein
MILILGIVENAIHTLMIKQKKWKCMIANKKRLNNDL